MNKKRYESPAMIIVALKRMKLLQVSGGDNAIKGNGEKNLFYGGEDTEGLIDPS